MAQTVSVREVNQHTSAVLARVRAGEELVVTSSGQPQARLIPFRPGDAYERLLAAGKIIPAATREFRIAGTYRGAVDVDAVLDDERAERDLSW